MPETEVNEVEASERDAREPVHARKEVPALQRGAIDEFVNQRRYDYADKRTPNPIQILTDLIDYVRADIDTVLDNKTIPLKEKKEKFQDLSSIQNTAVNIITGETTEESLEAVRGYIVQQLEQDRQIPDDVSHMFDSFLQILPDTNTDSEQQAPQEQETVNNQERLPANRYNANRTTQLLKTNFALTT